MQTFFVVASWKGLEELRHRAGYVRAVGLLDEMRDLIGPLCREAASVRSNRHTVEFTVRSPGAVALRQTLDALADALRGDIVVRNATLPRQAAFAAVPCRNGVTDALIAQAESMLMRGLREGVPVAIAERGAEERDDRRLMADLRSAILNDELELHYQPKLRARGGMLAGTEALARWTHPTVGPIGPDLFIPMAERSGDIHALTEWVFGRVLADRLILRDVGLSIPTNVNVSAPSFAERGFAARTLGLLGDGAGEVGIEITETAMIADPEGSLLELRQLAEAGVRLAIDDYGAGFSSLAYLQRLPVHELKIDRTFIARLSTGARDPLLVRSTIDLAHALEMEVTAEGVPNAAALALLQVMRCDLVQGFFLAKPLTRAELISYAHAADTGAALPKPLSMRQRLLDRLGDGSRAA